MILNQLNSKVRKVPNRFDRMRLLRAASFKRR